MIMNKRRTFFKTFETLKKIGLLSLLISLFFISCNQPQNSDYFKSIDVLADHGEFLKIEHMIDSIRQIEPQNDTDLKKIDSIQDVIHRIRINFPLDEIQIKEQLSRYYSQIDDSLILQWENSGKLEMRIIDGEKRFFNNAVSNLFRLDSLAALHKEQIDGKQPDLLKLFCLTHTQKVIRESKNNSGPVIPVNMILTYTIKLKANAVPDGEIIRCWMPFPREGKARQTAIKLISSNPDSSIIAPGNYLQHSIYLEKKAKKDQLTEFRIKFSVQTAAQYFNLRPEDVKSYDTKNEIYRKYTSERPPQLVFTPEIKKLGAQLVGNETNPLRKVEKIYTWINNSIPWASALEYSIMPDIPAYVLANRHGDCGMQTLLFMSLARSVGIPVKWQSGWMLHPDQVNLHDWCEVYYEGIGWVPLDQSFNLQDSPDQQLREFYIHGIDAYRLIVNDDYSQILYPAKKFARSEPYDFQRGELEWNGGNLYFDQWIWHMDVDYQIAE